MVSPVIVGKVNAEVGRRMNDERDRKDAIATFLEGQDVSGKKEDIEAAAGLFITETADAMEQQNDVNIPQMGVAKNDANIPQVGAQLDPNLDQSISNFKLWVPPTYRKYGHVKEASPHDVGNVPPDRQTFWARHPGRYSQTTYPRLQAKGYRPVHPNEVTNDPTDTSKLYVKQYEADGRFVVVHDVVLLIAYKEWQEGRYAAERGESAERVDSRKDKDRALDGMEVTSETSYSPMSVGG